MEKVTFGAGCFWCIEAVFNEIEGVTHVEPGYAGGHTKNPSYRDVVTGATGHAEVIRAHYDPSVVSFQKLLEVFFKIHDPTRSIARETILAHNTVLRFFTTLMHKKRRRKKPLRF